MAAKESSLLKLVLSLTLVSLFAAAALASVYVITKEPIEQAALKKKSDAIQAIIQSYNPESGHIQSEVVNIEGEESLSQFTLLIKMKRYLELPLKPLPTRHLEADLTLWLDLT